MPGAGARRAVAASRAVSPAPAAPPTTPPAPVDAGPQIPAEGAFTLPGAWTACSADADCTIVSMGCCDVTPVNRTHAATARDAMEAAGRRNCPVKAACGPSAHGTWDGEPGVCTAGTCAMPPSR